MFSKAKRINPNYICYGIFTAPDDNKIEMVNTNCCSFKNSLNCKIK